MSLQPRNSRKWEAIIDSIMEKNGKNIENLEKNIQTANNNVSFEYINQKYEANAANYVMKQNDAMSKNVPILVTVDYNNGIVAEFNMSIYRLFRAATLIYFCSQVSPGKETVIKVKSAANNKLIMETLYNTKKNGRSAYTLSSYHSKCKINLNGHAHKSFVHEDLPRIIAMMSYMNKSTDIKNNLNKFEKDMKMAGEEVLKAKRLTKNKKIAVPKTKMRYMKNRENSTSTLENISEEIDELELTVPNTVVNEILQDTDITIFNDTHRHQDNTSPISKQINDTNDIIEIVYRETENTQYIKDTIEAMPTLPSYSSIISDSKASLTETPNTMSTQANPLIIDTKIPTMNETIQSSSTCISPTFISPTLSLPSARLFGNAVFEATTPKTGNNSNQIRHDLNIENNENSLRDTVVPTEPITAYCQQADYSKKTDIRNVDDLNSQHLNVHKQAKPPCQQNDVRYRDDYNQNVNHAQEQINIERAALEKDKKNINKLNKEVERKNNEIKSKLVQIEAFQMSQTQLENKVKQQTQLIEMYERKAKIWNADTHSSMHRSDEYMDRVFMDRPNQCCGNVESTRGNTESIHRFRCSNNDNETNRTCTEPIHNTCKHNCHFESDRPRNHTHNYTHNYNNDNNHYNKMSVQHEYTSKKYIPNHNSNESNHDHKRTEIINRDQNKNNTHNQKHGYTAAHDYNSSTYKLSTNTKPLSEEHKYEGNNYMSNNSIESKRDTEYDKSIINLINNNQKLIGVNQDNVTKLLDSVVIMLQHITEKDNDEIKCICNKNAHHTQHPNKNNDDDVIYIDSSLYDDDKDMNMVDNATQTFSIDTQCSNIDISTQTDILCYNIENNIKDIVSSEVHIQSANSSKLTCTSKNISQSASTQTGMEKVEKHIMEDSKKVPVHMKNMLDSLHSIMIMVGLILMMLSSIDWSTWIIISSYTIVLITGKLINSKALHRPNNSHLKELGLKKSKNYTTLQTQDTDKSKLQKTQCSNNILDICTSNEIEEPNGESYEGTDLIIYSSYKTHNDNTNNNNDTVESADSLNKCTKSNQDICYRNLEPTHINRPTEYDVQTQHKHKSTQPEHNMLESGQSDNTKL